MEEKFGFAVREKIKAPHFSLLSLQLIRSHLKIVFSPELGVEPSSQVLDILEYACGLRLGLALISGKNPNFEIASSYILKFIYFRNNPYITRHSAI